jgi:putative transposase
MRSQDYPVRQLGRVLGYPRSRYYYRTQACDEAPLQAAISRLAAERPTDGYRRITALLRRAGFPVNRKHMARLMRALGLQGQCPARRPRTTHSDYTHPHDPNLVQGLQIVHPNHTWGSDITDVRLPDEFVYLAVLMDAYTCGICGWHPSRHLDHTLTLTALRRALARHRPKIHHADRGVRYAATAYVQTLRDVGAQLSMATVGEATENGYSERLMRTIKEEEVTLRDYADFHDAYRHIARVLNHVYQHKRIHSALGYLTPAEFETQWQQQPMAAASMQLLSFTKVGLH